LTYGLDDERRRFIFSASGQGGVGKTTLLRLFAKLATEANAKVAWVDETIDDLEKCNEKNKVGTIACHKVSYFL